jgi:hypothetical protein
MNFRDTQMNQTRCSECASEAHACKSSFHRVTPSVAPHKLQDRPTLPQVSSLIPVSTSYLTILSFAGFLFALRLWRRRRHATAAQKQERPRKA